MKINYLLVTLIVALFAIFSYADGVPMSYYTISPEKVEKYAEQDLLKDTAAVFDTLNQQKAFKYESRSQMAEKINEKFKAYPQHQKIVNNFIQTSWTVREDTVTDVMGMLNMQAYLDDNSIDSLKWYIIDDATNQMVFSQQAYDFVKQMEGTEFLDSTQLHRYAKNLLASSFKLCSGKVNNLDKYIDATLESFFTKKRKNLVDSIRNVQSEKCKKEKDYGACMEKKCNMRQIYSNVGKILISDIHREKRFIKRYSGRICSDDLWKKSFDRLDTLYSLYLRDVVDSTLVKIDNSEDAPINLNIKTCGCSHKEELNGGVVGFYPYWYAGDTTKWVDFEGITRLAYYGLQIDESGTLHTASGAPALAYLDKEENYEFVNEAHRHNVKLDWVVFKEDWKGVKLKEFFNKLSFEIDALLNTKVNSYFQRFVNAFTFYTDEFENRGNGVTLYFKNFPKDEESKLSFNEFFKGLKDSLISKNEYVHVNLMMDRSDLAIDKRQLFADSLIQDSHSGIYSYNNFLVLLNAQDADRKISRKQIRDEVKNYLFVVLDEPASRNKQILLNDLNLQLDSLDRRNMLHSLVPVVWFDNVGWSQFSKDALYYNDTYYNLGVGPYATALDAEENCAVSGNLGDCMLKHFENEEGDGLRQGAVASFFCTHRWVFRFLNIITFLIAIGVLVAYFTSFRVADFFNGNLALLLGIVVAPSAVMMTIISRLDPSVAAYRGTFGLIPILLLLLTVIAIILIQVYRKNDLPKRRGMYKGK
ncbi:hypothetical protein SAMN06298224_1572 [Fibrobacter sp. UWB16]|uniref:hypothetical protein n=1 Tax=Fibrobacter sp. UWB16 TaxID=1945874 RepID=UPI000BDDD6BC|nr:hypothetical protein [Fibrobacter sp. UWB16]SOD13929.1 hypothetical protein SAMN06298224_1572 [Fibrobacter sp. UWB16]